MKVYERDSYQGILNDYISFQRNLGLKITYQKIAEIMRVQKSYLSKVMASNASLSKDQLFLFAQKANLNTEETEYLFLLLDIEKCANNDLKKILTNKAKKISLLNTQSQNYLDKDKVLLSSQEMNLYYLSAENQLIHLALAIPKYQNDLDLLRNHSKISADVFSKSISLLQSLELISINENSAKLLRSNLHLSPTSPYFNSWKNQLAIKAMEWEKSLDTADKYNFTVSFTADEQTKENIRLEFLKMLKTIEELVSKAPSETLYQMNFNLFKWI